MAHFAQIVHVPRASCLLLSVQNAFRRCW